MVKAQEMFVSTLKWRAQFKVDEIMKEQFPDEVFEKVGKVKGKDKEGRPVTYDSGFAYSARLWPDIEQ